MILADILERLYQEVYFDEFYREIFQEGYLAPWDTDQPRMVYPSGEKWYYTGIAMEQLPDTWPAKDGQKPRRKVVRYPVYDDLAALHELVEDPAHRDNFIFLAPVSYVGYRRLNRNARQLFALCIEIDDLIVKGGIQEGLRSLLLDIDQEYSPRPTFMLCSGSGVHLYYVFDRPINLYPSIFKQLEKMKKDLTKRLWNRRITTSHDKVQYEGVCQPFRMLGTVTKSGQTTRAFQVGDKCDIEYLNGFVKEKNRVFLHYEKYQRAAGVTPLKEAAAKWPDWYARVPERQRAGKKPVKRTWQTNRAMYDRFLERIPYEARAGHRYNSLLVLGSCAIKCGISREEYEADCWNLLPQLDFDPSNPFTKDDVLHVIQAHKSKDLVTMTVEAAAALSGMKLERAKRNGRKQSEHMRRITLLRDSDYPDGSWRNKDGRPRGSGTAQETVQHWRQVHPDGSKKECLEATGLTYPTIRKWWDVPLKEATAGPDFDNVIFGHLEDDWRLSREVDNDENV